MVKVALTGGIATGKSYVLARLQDRGMATIEADDIVHQALGEGTAATKSIATQFGTAILRADGSVNRTLLGVMVFRDPIARLTLESIIHPVVYDRLRSWYASLDAPAGVASIPLLFETQHEGDFDFVVVTACTPEHQLERLIARDSLDEDDAKRRIAAQLPTEEKVARADFVIRTDGTKAQTDEQVDELLRVLSSR